MHVAPFALLRADSEDVFAARLKAPVDEMGEATDGAMVDLLDDVALSEALAVGRPLLP